MVTAVEEVGGMSLIEKFGNKKNLHVLLLYRHVNMTCMNEHIYDAISCIVT